MTSQDLRRLFEFIRETYALRALDGFSSHVVTALPGLVASDHTSYVEIDFRRRRVARVSNPPGPGFSGADRVFETRMHENPVLDYQRRTGDGQALRISDFITQRQFRRTRLYNEFHRPLGGADRQIAFRLDARSSLTVAMGLNRAGRDFSDRERLVVELIRPHLMQAYRNAEAVTRVWSELALARRGLEALDTGIVLLGRSGVPRLVMARARRYFAEYFDHETRRGGRLPESVQRWLRAQQARPRDDTVVPCEPLVVERDGRRLTVRRMSDADGSVLLLTEQQTTIRAERLRALGLTRREAEVLAWVAEGRTNSEIATITGARPRTVGKHLEHVYQKLGVETRTAAAALVYRALEAAPATSPS